MARITVEDCLENVENRFALVHIAAKRSRELFKGVEPLVRCKNREVVTSLREIADEKIKFVSPEPEVKEEAK
jgi:DNA-directed RNA polymerase subunit omega